MYFLVQASKEIDNYRRAILITSKFQLQSKFETDHSVNIK
jgi:hypothetical protein